MKTYAQRMKKPQFANPQQNISATAQISNQAMLGMLNEPQGDTRFSKALRERFELKPAPTVDEGTPLPDNLRKKYEEKSGLPMDDVRVHYNSNEPSKMKAFAYTYGSDIYLGTSQEKWLEHELGHVVQQKYGIVRPNKLENGLPVNDSANMEINAETSPRYSGKVAQSKPSRVVQKCSWLKKLFGGCFGCCGDIDNDEATEVSAEKSLGRTVHSANTIIKPSPTNGPCVNSALERLGWENDIMIQNEDGWNAGTIIAPEALSNFFDGKERESVLLLFRYNDDNPRGKIMPNKIFHSMTLEPNDTGSQLFGANNDVDTLNKLGLKLEHIIASTNQTSNPDTEQAIGAIFTCGGDISTKKDTIESISIRYLTQEQYNSLRKRGN